jgi:hypothetical protein
MAKTKTFSLDLKRNKSTAILQAKRRGIKLSACKTVRTGFVGTSMVRCKAPCAQVDGVTQWFKSGNAVKDYSDSQRCKR